MDGFLVELLSNIGQTVTIFTASGGESGIGFTGVLSMVNHSFVRLITQIGPAPGCALGNCCEESNQMKIAEGAELGGHRMLMCRPNGLGSIVDIPVDKIVALVHNAVGSN